MERDEEDGLGKLVPIFFFVEFLFSPWGVYISTRFGPDGMYYSMESTRYGVCRSVIPPAIRFLNHAILDWRIQNQLSRK